MFQMIVIMSSHTTKCCCCKKTLITVDNTKSRGKRAEHVNEPLIMHQSKKQTNKPKKYTPKNNKKINSISLLIENGKH